MITGELQIKTTNGSFLTRDLFDSDNIMNEEDLIKKAKQWIAFHMDLHPAISCHFMREHKDSHGSIVTIEGMDLTPKIAPGWFA